MTAHTPTPWSVFNNPASNYGLEVLTNTTVKAKHVACRIGGPDRVANAAFIVRAVNNHDALVTALTAAKEHLDYCGYGDTWERECAQTAKLEEKIEAALKNATE